MTTSEQVRAWRGPAVLSYGFRPFFLGAALWAVGSVILWVLSLSGYDPLPSVEDVHAWHAHEMLFGYLGAVIAGFLLTAIPNWTGSLPVVGKSLFALVLLWIAGRVVMALPAALPWGPVAFVELSFLAALAAFLFREIIAGKNWRNLPVFACLGAFLLGDALFHLDIARANVPSQGAGYRLGLAAGLMLIAIIGGRVVPSFTRNWLVKNGYNQRPAAPMQGFDRTALIALLVALLAWVIWPMAQATAFALAVSGVLHFLRLIRWCAHLTWREPLLAVLHLAYVFLPLGALAHSTAIFLVSPEFATASLHVWTIGAIGTMTLAVMTRATLGHTGASLHADAGTALIYAALPVSLVFRLMIPTSSAPELMLALSTFAWCAAFGGFAVLYGPRLVRPRKNISLQASSRKV